jgi:hypothetical protein
MTTPEAAHWTVIDQTVMGVPSKRVRVKPAKSSL